jgi:hypothetical protein
MPDAPIPITPKWAHLSGPDCTLAGPGRGDCEHFVGLPGIPVTGQHDGPDITIDEYGRPNGWCWSCWKSHKLAIAEMTLREHNIPIPDYYRKIVY